MHVTTMNLKTFLYLFLTSIIHLLCYVFHIGNNFYIVHLLLAFKGGFLIIFADSYLALFIRFYFICDDGWLGLMACIFNCQGVTIPKNHLCNLSKILICLFEILLACWHYFESAFIFLLILTYIFFLLQCHGDIELHPGSQS